MGSSMGGLISVYAVCEYPQVFGGAAGLSIHWVGRSTKLWGAEKIQNAALPLAAFNYLQTHLPPPGSHRIYVDHGTQGIDAYYGVHHQFIDELAKERGYTPAQWQSRIYEGTDHTEGDWAARVSIPLRFLLAPP